MQTGAGPRWRSWSLLILAATGGLMAFGLSALLLVFGGGALLGANFQPARTVSLFNLAWTSALVGGLCIPTVVFAIRELNGKSAQPRSSRKSFLLASAAMLLWAALVLLFKPVETSQLAWLLLPPLVVVATLIPLWWYLEIGGRGLGSQPNTRTWGLVSSSLVVTLPLTLVIQILVLVVVFIGAMIYISTQPALLEQLMQYSTLFTDPNIDPTQLTDVMTGWLQQPWAIVLMLTLIAGVFPLLEELLKPLALWLFAGDRLSPAQGFVGGMVCGASFALWENLSALSTAGDGSGTITLVARVGTGLLHILTTGLVGWGMASAWQDRRSIPRLVGAYLAASLIHGTWNAFGVFSGVAPLLQLADGAPGLATALGDSASIVLFILILVNLFLLIFINTRLRKRLAAREVSIPQAAQSAALQEESHDRSEQETYRQD